VPFPPDPRGLLGLVDRLGEQLEQLMAVVPRLGGLLDAASHLVEEMEALMARVEVTRSSAAEAITRIDDTQARAAEAISHVDATQEEAADAIKRVDATQADAAGVIERVDATRAVAEALIARVEDPVRRASRLLDLLEPSLLALQPVLERLAHSTDPREVEALVRLVDHAPHLVDRLEEDILPVVATLGSVAPDLRDLLDVSRELNEMLGKLPGICSCGKRVEQEQEHHVPAPRRSSSGRGSGRRR